MRQFFLFKLLNYEYIIYLGKKISFDNKNLQENNSLFDVIHSSGGHDYSIISGSGRIKIITVVYRR